MTQAQEILEYIYLEYISGADFLAQISTAKSQSDIDSILRYSVKDAIGAYGYRTDLWYDNVMRAHLGDLAGRSRWSTPKQKQISDYDKIFNLNQDPYFGETINFNPEVFSSFIDRIIEKSEFRKKVINQIAKFGDAGLRKAVARLASEHQWVMIHSDSSADHTLSEESERATNIEPLQRTYLLSSTEGARVVDEIRNIKGIIESAELSQTDRTQALMLADSALILSQMPVPNWKMVKELLYIIAAISTVLAAAIQVAEMIK